MSAPSPERIRRARARGTYPFSRSLSVAAQLVVALIALDATVDALRTNFTGSFVRALSAASAHDPMIAAGALAEGLASALRCAAPVMAVAMGALLLSQLVQTRFLLVWPRRITDAPRGAPLSGMFWHGAVTSAALWGAWTAVPGSLPPRSMAGWVEAFRRVGSAAIGGAVMAMVGLGALELFWRRTVFFRAMTPTRAEAQRERREQEGDPRVREARRHAQRARADGAEA